MKKQIISTMLVLIIILNCCVMTAFAQTEDVNSVTFYFHCPANFTKNGEVICILIPKKDLGSDIIYGELMDNGLYKFVIPDYSLYWAFVIDNNVESISEADPNHNYVDAFFTAENNSVEDYDSYDLINIENKIYSNCCMHFAEWKYVYGFGEWVDFEEWNRYKTYLKYTSNEEYECVVLEDFDYWCKYKELYTFGNNVLTFGANYEKSTEASYGVYGNYVLRNDETYSPSVSGFNIYVSDTDSFVSLREAYNTNIDGIESVFTDYGIGELIGDVDKDKSLTIFDATTIQRNLAQISDFASNDEIQGVCEDGSVSISYISDFNRDGVRDIFDATAIQKQLASL